MALDADVALDALRCWPSIMVVVVKNTRDETIKVDDVDCQLEK
jgi:hypothetical protein